MTTYADALAAGRAALAASGIETAALDARLLLAVAAGLDAAQLIARSGEALSEVAGSLFDAHLRRRIGGEPVARILGEAEFWSLRFKLGPATLLPRPDTETLVEAVLSETRRRHLPKISICDLGTGCGAIIIALLSELPEAVGVATDISPEALAVARENAERLGVLSRLRFECCDFATGPNGRFDVVVSNPPYVRSGDIAKLQRDVRDHDPRVALDGGADGLASYRAILVRAGGLLRERGFIAFEVGYDQSDSVAELCMASGLGSVRKLSDLSGAERVVIAGMEQAEPRKAGPKKALGKVG